MEGLDKVWTVRYQSAFRADGVSSGRRSALDSLLIMCVIYRKFTYIIQEILYFHASSSDPP